MGEIPPSAVLGYPGRVITFQRAHHENPAREPKPCFEAKARRPSLFFSGYIGSNFSTPAGRFLRLPRSRFSTVPLRLHKPSQGMAGKDKNKQTEHGKQGIARTGLVSNRAELFGLFIGDRKIVCGRPKRARNPRNLKFDQGARTQA
jgi:hypothetical protein